MKNTVKSTEFDTEMARRALELAEQGVGQVSPGPLVGCVVVNQKGEVVGEGTYFYKNETHAEVVALKEAGSKAIGGTAYISLEPHSHHGRTPPCTEALIASGIKRVVVPIEDPNPLVSGKGFANLRAHGVEVDTGLLSDEASIQNEKFIHWHRFSRPFVHIKVAASLDGCCATKSGDSKWITGESARAKGHLLRHEYDAILVGKGTVEEDDPSLTDRSGRVRNKRLRRVILDSELCIKMDSSIVKSADLFPTIIVAKTGSDPEKVKALEESDLIVNCLPNGGYDLMGLLSLLGEMGMQSILVEGGPSVTGSFFDHGLVDKVSYFISPMVIGGVDARSAVGGLGPDSLDRAIRLRDIVLEKFDEDFELTGYPANSATGENSAN